MMINILIIYSSILKGEWWCCTITLTLPKATANLAMHNNKKQYYISVNYLKTNSNIRVLYIWYCSNANTNHKLALLLWNCDIILLVKESVCWRFTYSLQYCNIIFWSLDENHVNSYEYGNRYYWMQHKITTIWLQLLQEHASVTNSRRIAKHTFKMATVFNWDKAYLRVHPWTTVDWKGCFWCYIQNVLTKFHNHNNISYFLKTDTDRFSENEQV